MNDNFHSILLKTIKIPKNIMHLSSRLPKKNYQNMTVGYGSEERQSMVVNFKDKGFHHNTMGKNQTMETKNSSIESP